MRNTRKGELRRWRHGKSAAVANALRAYGALNDLRNVPMTNDVAVVRRYILNRTAWNAMNISYPEARDVVLRVEAMATKNYARDNPKPKP